MKVVPTWKSLRNAGIEGLEVSLHSSLTSVLDKDKWSASRSDRFNLGKKTPVVTGECVSSEVGLVHTGPGVNPAFRQ